MAKPRRWGENDNSKSGELTEVPFSDLRQWIKTLDKAGELVRISQPVSPYLEMSEIADRTAKLGSKSGSGGVKAGGPALLFENVVGHPGARVLMNQFGSLRRMHLALDTDSLDAIAERIRTLYPAGVADQPAGQAEAAAEAGGGGELFSKGDRARGCTLQGGDPAAG